jgi:putative SOS response-associated peptidase YedK
MRVDRGRPFAVTLDRMCGRYVLARPSAQLASTFRVQEPAQDIPEASYNVSPTDQVPVVFESAHGEDYPVRRMESARWMFVPWFSKDLKSKRSTFNAKAETVAKSSMYGPSVKSKRALIPADGYYEWGAADGKTPFYIHPKDGSMLAFAGLYSWWKNPHPEGDTDKWVLSATIIVCDAIGTPATIHDRMPVALPESFWDHWLDPTVVGDQRLVDEAVGAGGPISEHLDVYQVAPITPKSDRTSPTLIRPA